MAPLTKKTCIDYIIYQATGRLFYGDGRDGKAPPITLLNFDQETLRYGARTLRARLARSSYRQVLQEGMAAVEHIEHAQAQRTAALDEVEQAKREESLRANRRQLEAAIAAKYNNSQVVDGIVAQLAGPLLKKHPKWASNRCAVAIEQQVNDALRTKGRRPLKSDAIRKRIERYRTHVR